MSGKKSGLDRWIPVDNGCENTDSPRFIKQAISSLKFIILLHKDYQSGNTILVSADNNSLTIDRPRDWPGRRKKIKVIYRDEAKVWNYFITEVIAEYKDTLKTTFPTQLFRLQRRAHFRIAMPASCTASFRRKNDKFSNIMVNDISIGGMSIWLRDTEDTAGLEEEDALADIIINLSDSQGDDGGDDSVAIAQGLIVRAFTMDNGQKCLGIQFHLQGNEEQRLMHFVRQNELAALRKGML